MKLVGLCMLVWGGISAWAGVIPSNCEQAIVGTAQGWNTPMVKLNLLEKKQGVWQHVAGPIDARLGKNGLVWGRGISPIPEGATTKREGDLRSPAGVFQIGGIYCTVPTPQKHNRMPCKQVTAKDLWVSDVNSPLYNQHVVLKQAASTPWEINEQMKLNDAAHSIKLLIHHNTTMVQGGPVRGGGSSIFFHIWRHNGNSVTAGCTTMSEQNIRAIIAWLNPMKKPVYILLPRQEYLRLRTPWGLP